MIELAKMVGVPAPWSIPRWILRPFAPYGEIFIGETSIRASNALARSELGWAPSVTTYCEGVKKIAKALRYT